MKIKTKKQLNLPQLIEWVIENKKFNTMFNSDKCNIVLVSDRGTIEFTGLFYDDLFTVEVEEELTEETKLEYSIEIYKVDNIGWVRSTEHRNVSISQMKNRGSIVPLSYYILNDDFTLTLIWTHEKGLVD